MSEKLKVGILGGTGMVGQRFISFGGSSVVRSDDDRSKREIRGKDV